MEWKAIVSVSGGKDSTATCLYLDELGIEYEAIFMDVGWDNKATYDYLTNDLPGIIGKSITWLRHDVELTDGYEAETLEIEEMLGIKPSAMVRLCVKKGIFPTRTMRWCTELLKVGPAISYFKSQKRDDRTVVNVIGVRRQESRARQGVVDYEWSNAHGGIVVWRPLAAWSEQDVIDIHRRHGVKPNRNYFMGASRVGCWPCIHARKDEIRRIAETDPARIRAVERLEVLVTRRANDRRMKQEKPTYPHFTWFQNSSGERIGGLHSGECWPIGKVVQWAKTSRGGRQYELFDLPDSEAGCLRWGFCEANNG